MGHAEGDALGNRWMLGEDVVYFSGSDLLSSTINEFLQAAGQKEIAVRIDPTLVARAKPPVDPRTMVGSGIAFVASRNTFPSYNHLSNVSSGQRMAGLIHDGDVGPGGHPDRPGLALRSQRITRHLMGSFGHAVRLDDRRGEDLLESGEHSRRQRGG